jgi:hypothetical protein
VRKPASRKSQILRFAQNDKIQLFVNEIMSANYNILLTKLDEFIRKYYKNQVLRGVLYCTAVGMLFYLSITLMEYYAHFDTGMRTFLFYSFLIVNGFIVSRLIIIPLLKLYHLGAVISYEKAAEIIGNHFNNVQDKLLNVLQLQQTTSNLELGTLNLSHAAIDQKIKDLKPVPFSSAINLGENKKYLKYALPPVFILLFILFSAPSIITDSTRRLVKHSTYYEKEAPFQFTIQNKDLKAVQQEDFELQVKLVGNEVPDNIYVSLEGNEYKLNKENTIEFSYLFKNLQKSTHFKLTADGYQSKEYELAVMPNPILLNFSIALNYPKYLGKHDEVIKNTGDLLIPVGTKVTWNLNTQNTNMLRMSFSDTALALQPSAKDAYIFSARVMSDKHYAITTANEFIRSKDSVVYSINVIPDQYPALDVEEKKDSLSQKLVYFKGQVKDDYGFSNLTFNYRFINKVDTINTLKPVVSRVEPSQISDLKSLTIPINKSLNQDQFFYAWDLNKLNIASGDALEYYFEIWDNDGVHGPKSARSQKMVFKAPTMQEISENTEKSNSKIKEELKETIQEAKDLQKQLNDLNKKVLEKKELNWEEKKKMQDLLQKQNELQQKVESIKNENQKNNVEQSEFKQVDQQIAEKQKQLEDLLQQVLTPEMKQKMEELQKMLSEMDKNKMQNELEKMKMNAKDVEKELDRALESFKRLEVEQKFQENMEKLKEMKKEQDELAKKSDDKKSDTKELEKKQDELNKKFEDFQKDMKELEKKNNALEQPNELENTEKKQEEIKQDMKASDQQLQQNKKNKASESQKSASEKMDQLAQKMQQQQQQMQQEANSEDAKSLRQILDNLLELSFDQEALMNDLKKIRTDNPQYPKIAQQQKKLQDDSKMIEDSLLALSKRVPTIKSAVNREISAINMNMEKAIGALAERQTSEAASRQQFSMTSINNLALMLNESLQQMQQEQQSQCKKPGSGNCKKPGGMGKKPSMSNMRQMQQQLNEQIQKMKEAMEKGKKPGEKGKDGKQGNNGQQGMSEQLAKLAAQQEYIRQQMQKAGEGLENGKQGNKPGGDAAQKMEETETDLVNKLISQETIKRQQEILTRLLDYEKAEKERDQDEKRQSIENKKDFIRNPNAFLEYNRLKEREIELLKTIPPTLNPFYKTKVNEYFNNFE